MKLRLAALVMTSLMMACAGVPLGSLPRLARLQSQLLDANPAEFMLAIQVDARMVPPPGAAPMLLLAIAPLEPGAFEPVDKKLPMLFAVASADSLGLAPPDAHRRWLVYSLTPASQQELLDVQSRFKTMRAQGHGKGGGRVGLGIAQDGVASRNPELINTRWESWLQTSRQEGFVELWLGSVADLLRQAQSAKQASAR